MIYQIYFTLALEFLTLVMATALVVWSSQDKLGFRVLAKIIGFTTIIATIILIGTTSYKLFNYKGKGQFSSSSKKPKLQLQVMPSGPAVGGKLKDPLKYNNKPIKLNLQ